LEGGMHRGPRGARRGSSAIFQVGTLGALFSGTVWFDDIKIQ
jgi:hypothetical protein